ncbi:hypothetical protein [Streptomyces sp. NPDC059649]|uniref:hypothetical protein n=1 Tax=Streptomyces sp. NPDC059649 TaxID=3346895 RepID=UPI0036779AA6
MTQRTRRGQGLWLTLVGSASVALALTSAAQSQGRIGVAELLPGIVWISTTPGVLALAQSLLLRRGHLDPAMIGVAALSVALIGMNGDEGNGRLLLGVLLALVVAVPFALLSSYLTLTAGRGYTVVSAVAVLLGADKLAPLIGVDEFTGVSAPLIRAMSGRELWLPTTAWVAAAVFVLVGVVRPVQEVRLREGNASGWVRPALLVFVPAFLLSVLAGLLDTANIQAVDPGGMSAEMAACLLVLTAGGCSLSTGEANVIDVAVGALFLGAFDTLLHVMMLPARQDLLLITAAAALFALIDLARLRPVPDDDPTPDPPSDPAPPSQAGNNGPTLPAS